MDDDTMSSVTDVGLHIVKVYRYCFGRRYVGYFGVTVDERWSAHLSVNAG